MTALPATVPRLWEVRSGCSLSAMEPTPTIQKAIDPELHAVRVIVVTTFEIDQYVFEALHLGASGFILKDTAPADFVHAIRPATVAGLDTLTAREREIAAWVATGRSNDEIAEALFLSPATVRTHVIRAMTKLNARSRAHLVVLAVRAGLNVAP
jgi:DNA-binding NarL/FixJ family response regulator